MKYGAAILFWAHFLGPIYCNNPSKHDHMLYCALWAAVYVLADMRDKAKGA